MKLPIYLYGSKVLRENAQEADLSDREKLTQLIADMEETLASADGCGLAAPQVGVPVRVLIVDGRDLTLTADERKSDRRHGKQGTDGFFHFSECSFSLLPDKDYSGNT